MQMLLNQMHYYINITPNTKNKQHEKQKQHKKRN
jgi:hypothetical protein